MIASRPVLRRSLVLAAAVTLAAAAVLGAVLAISDGLFIHTSGVNLDTGVRAWFLNFERRPQALDLAMATGTMPAGLVAWRLDAAGTVIGSAGLPPDLPAAYRQLQGPATAVLNGSVYELIGGPLPDGGWLVVGGDRDVVVKPQQNVLQAQLVTVPPALLAVFLAALAVGHWVAGPVERARQHQLAFVANASHELRTPLAVLEGEVSLARSRPRSAAEYRQAFDRVAQETAAVHSLVDDLLWLARFDADPEPPPVETVPLADVARQARDRFAGLAGQRGLELTVFAAQTAAVRAPRPWIDRLAGVLLANACAYTPGPGRVQITVVADAGGPRLLVDDSGPGIPPDQRERIFERFFRARNEGEGAGLGLSIADAVVRATGGIWEVTASPLGGARFEVRWPDARSQPISRRLRGWGGVWRAAMRRARAGQARG